MKAKRKDSKRLAAKMQKMKRGRADPLAPLFWHPDHPTLLAEVLRAVNAKCVLDLTPGDGAVAMTSARRGALLGLQM